MAFSTKTIRNFTFQSTHIHIRILEDNEINICVALLDNIEQNLLYEVKYKDDCTVDMNQIVYRLSVWSMFYTKTMKCAVMY